MLAVLVGPRPGLPPAPETTPIGRAALALARDGITVGFTADGREFLVARPGGWRPLPAAPVRAAQDRFPSQTWPQAYRRALDALGRPPLGNPESLTVLCRDKLATQDWLQDRIPMPAVEGSSSRFEATLQAWGEAYLKPRFGAMGRGIRRVVPGDELPRWIEGAVRGVLEPTFLQRAVTTPGSGAVAVRQLIQRLPEGGWLQLPGVARVAPPGEPVANVSRGALARPADPMLDAGCLAEIKVQTALVARALADHEDGDWALEAGVDFAVDADGHPHLLEVNSRPQGRLEALAISDPDLWHDAHVEACARPLRRLWVLSRG
jgi:glutathione synthase/RimK-type ligase-like ATP-grasp enzyme